MFSSNVISRRNLYFLFFFPRQSGPVSAVSPLFSLSLSVNNLENDNWQASFYPNLNSFPSSVTLALCPKSYFSIIESPLNIIDLSSSPVMRNQIWSDCEQAVPSSELWVQLPGFLYWRVGQGAYVVPAPPGEVDHQQAPSVFVPHHGGQADGGAQPAGVPVLPGVEHHGVAGGNCSSVFHGWHWITASLESVSPSADLSPALEDGWLPSLAALQVLLTMVVTSF